MRRKYKHQKNQQNIQVDKAYLFGPFVGELSWEMYRFAPYAIHLKKTRPKYKSIIYTREDRFDLYGKYADVLVPLSLKNEEKHIQHKFGISNFSKEHYDLIVKYFYEKYKKRFEIIDHFYPRIHIWHYKVKWQFPRNEMCYDFRPRKENMDIIEGLFDNSSNVYVSEKNSDVRHGLIDKGYNPIMNHWLYDLRRWNNNISFLGCVITALKNCTFVVDNMNSWISRLALLLKIPVISIDEEMSYDSIHLLNPFDVSVISCRDIMEGIEIYENNI